MPSCRRWPSSPPIGGGPLAGDDRNPHHAMAYRRGAAVLSPASVTALNPVRRMNIGPAEAVEMATLDGWRRFYFPNGMTRIETVMSIMPRSEASTKRAALRRPALTPGSPQAQVRPNLGRRSMVQAAACRLMRRQTGRERTRVASREVSQPWLSASMDAPHLDRR